IFDPEGGAREKLGNTHAGGGDQEERLAPHLVHEQDGDNGEKHVDKPDDRRLADGRNPLEPGPFENARGIIKYGVDPGDLLEYGQDDGDEKRPPESRTEELGQGPLLEKKRLLDAPDFGGGGRGIGDPCQNAPGFFLTIFLAY